jgi:hypothetical protein
MLGEAGPEAVVPLSGAGRSLSQTVIVNINGPVFGIPDLERLIVETVRRRALSRGGFDHVF